MKDAYSFDRDEAGLDRSFQAHEGATSGSSSAAGSRRYAVQAECGMMGGSASRRLPRAVGLRREHARHAARTATTPPISRSRAASLARRSSRSPSTRPRRSRRRASTTIEALAEFLGIDPAATSKAMPVVARRRPARARARARRRPAGARRSSPALGSGFRPGDRRGDPRGVRRRRRLARPGRVRGRGRRRRDAARGAVRRRAPTAPAGTCAASRPAATTSRASPTSARPQEGDALPELRRRAPLPDRDRGRPHLQARHALLGAARRDVPRRGRQEQPLLMGELRDRPGADRSPPSSSSTTTSGASSGRRRSRRTTSTSLCSRPATPRSLRAPRRPRRRSRRRASTCSSTTATARPGEKFADADLIGAPVRVTVGKKTLEDGGSTFASARPGRRSGSRVWTLAKRVVDADAAAQKYSEEPFGATIERLMAETGLDLPRPRRQDGPLRRLPEPPRAREPPGAVERRRRRGSRSALGVEPEHFREYRLRVITDRLETMPDLIDRLYKRLSAVRPRAAR